MKHTKKFISCFMAIAMGLTVTPPDTLLKVSNVITVDAASPGDKLAVGNGTTQHKGTSDGYSYEIWLDRTGGSGTMTLGKGATFKAEWSASVPSGNFLARRGLDFGSTKKATDYEYIGLDYAADYRQTGSASGNSRLCVYGWFQNKGAAGNVPLVEYYIIEDWVDWCPDAPGKMVTIDGAQYKIFQMDHTGPTINGGSETFKQYFSVRQSKRKSGHITVSDHFKAWADQGWGIGNLYEVALNAEGWQSSGVADITELDVYTIPKDGTGSDGGYTPDTGQPSVGGDTPSGTGTGISDDFEGTGTSWSPRGDSVELLLTSDLKHGGSKSLAVTGRSASWNGASASSSDLKAGGSYSFSSYVTYNNSSYSSSGFEFGVQYDLNGVTNYDNIGSATTSSGKWTKLSGDFDVPAGAENISIYVQSAYTENDTAADMLDFYIDDVVFTSSGSSSGGDSNVGDATSLKNKFASCFKMGTSVSPNELNSGATFIKNHFNSITPENELKPDAIIDQSASQQKGNNVNTQVNLSRAAQTLKFCEQNGIGVRGHTFIWHSQTPDWFFRENFSNTGAYVSKEVMNQRIESFIKNTFEAIKTQYPNLDLYAYDVCNELFLNDGGGMRGVNATSNSAASTWAKIYGENNDEFVYTAFRAARKYAPQGCKLYINDYNEYIPAKTDDIYNLAMGLKAEGLIDGIGMQSHLDISYPSAEVYKTALEKFLSTGLEVSITELDITTNGDYGAQADLFKAIFEMAVENRANIPSFTVWGTHDSISWRSSQNPLLFGSGYTEKEAYKAVMSIDVPSDGQTPGTTTPNTQVEFKFGDINGDNKVDLTDLTALSLALLGDKQLTSTQALAADVSYDKSVDVADLALMKQYISKEDVILGDGYVAPVVTTTTTTTKPPVTTTTTTTSSNNGGITKMVGSMSNNVWSSNCDVSWIDPSKPMVAFTFDDGPVGTASNSTSIRIQDALTKNGFHATFFYWGNKINNSNSAEIKRAFDAGFEIGNHTYTHPYLTNLSASGIQSEINQTKSILNSIVGDGDFLVRPPYLSVNQTVLSSAGVPLINCGIDTEDWNNASKDQIVNKLKSAMQNGSLNKQIVLMHETYGSTASAMEELLPYMKSQGWQVVSVSELFKASGKQLMAGTTAYGSAK